MAVTSQATLLRSEKVKFDNQFFYLNNSITTFRNWSVLLRKMISFRGLGSSVAKQSTEMKGKLFVVEDFTFPCGTR
jgi:hypothetical protein